MRSLNIIVHDFAGHPPQSQLARALAKRGHRVTYAYFPYAQTATGQVERIPGDPPNFTIERVAIRRHYEKYQYVKRILAEREYGRRLAELVRAHDPDIFLTNNTPSDSIFPLLHGLKKARPAIIWWIGDIYSIGIEAIISRKSRLLGRMLGGFHRAAERRFGLSSKAIICISGAFLPHLAKLGIPKGKCHVIPIWAPSGEIVPGPKENRWKAEQGLSGKTVVLYSGTLGLKHNPAVFAKAARRLQAADKRDVMIVVVAERLAAENLRAVKAEQLLDQLLVLPWQPYERLSEVLSSGDVLVAQLEREAGQFSVPGKILSYLSVGRPILAAMLSENLGAQTIMEAKAGFIVDPDNDEEFLRVLDRLLANPALRDKLGRNARAYAERHFNIETITDQFEAIFEQAVRAPA